MVFSGRVIRRKLGKYLEKVIYARNNELLLQRVTCWFMSNHYYCCVKLLPVAIVTGEKLIVLPEIWHLESKRLVGVEVEILINMWIIWGK